MAKKNKKQVLGRGLSALLDDPEREIISANDINADKVVGNIIDLEIDKIEVNPYQPRTYFNEDSIEELAKSINVLGIIQPITVRKLGRNQYQLVSGERRYRAAKSIGISAIPAFVRIANDNEILEMALVENIQRKDLDPIEIALSFQRLVEEVNLTQDQLSHRVGKKRSTVSNYMRLLKLDPIIQTGIRDGFLTMGHGRALINIDETQKQLEIYEKIIAKSLSVRETELLVKKSKKVVPIEKTKSIKSEFYEDIAKELKNYFNTSVFIKASGKGKGVIQIPFNSNKDLNDFIKKIKRED